MSVAPKKDLNKAFDSAEKRAEKPIVKCAICGKFIREGYSDYDEFCSIACKRKRYYVVWQAKK